MLSKSDQRSTRLIRIKSESLLTGRTHDSLTTRRELIRFLTCDEEHLSSLKTYNKYRLLVEVCRPILW